MKEDDNTPVKEKMSNVRRTMMAGRHWIKDKGRLMVVVIGVGG